MPERLLADLVADVVVGGGY